MMKPKKLKIERKLLNDTTNKHATYFKKLEYDTGKQKVLGTLFNYPEKEFNASELAKKSEVRKSNIGAILQEFQQNNLITITQIVSTWRRIKANQNHFDFIKLKIANNLSFIYTSGLVEFLNMHLKNPKAIILFGSYRKGEDISTSDIDIAVETDMTNDYQIWDFEDIPKEPKEQLGSFEKLIGRKIQVHLFNRKKIDINVFNNIANGIVLMGFLEVKP